MKNIWNWMTDDEREEAEERAAIMQYHGNATREQAEFLAVDHIWKRRDTVKRLPALLSSFVQNRTNSR